MHVTFHSIILIARTPWKPSLPVGAGAPCLSSLPAPIISSPLLSTQANTGFPCYQKESVPKKPFVSLSGLSEREEAINLGYMLLLDAQNTERRRTDTVQSYCSLVLRHSFYFLGRSLAGPLFLLGVQAALITVTYRTNMSASFSFCLFHKSENRLRVSFG